MIDITSETAKRRELARTIRMQSKLETGLAKKLNPYIKKQYTEASLQVNDGLTDDLDRIISVGQKEIIDILTDWYTKSATLFASDLIGRTEKAVKHKIDIKAPMDIFWRTMKSYIAIMALSRARSISKTTKEQFKTILDRGISDGLSNVLIAKSFLDTGKVQAPFRAMRIARTEVHSVMGISHSEAAKSTGLMREKEWVSANDSRTRTVPFNHVTANGERVSIDDYYHSTGEALLHPGDYKNGSAGNIINCRCIEIYHTRSKLG